MNPFENFVRFVECELAVLSTEQEKKRGQSDLEQNILGLAKEQEKIDLLKQRITNLRKDIHAYELEDRAQRQRENELQRRLGITGNIKEYTAYRHELDELVRTRDISEDRLLKTLKEYESAQEEYNNRHEELEAQIKAQQHIVEENREKNLLLETAGTKLMQKCIELKQTVSPDLLKKYDAMRKTVTDPFVPVHENHCSACHFQIAQKDLIQIHKHLFIECKNCYRMLYAIH